MPHFSSEQHGHKLRRRCCLYSSLPTSSELRCSASHHVREHCRFARRPNAAATRPEITGVSPGTACFMLAGRYRNPLQIRRGQRSLDVPRKIAMISRPSHAADRSLPTVRFHVSRKKQCHLSVLRLPRVLPSPLLIGRTQRPNFGAGVDGLRASRAVDPPGAVHTERQTRCPDSLAP